MWSSIAGLLAGLLILSICDVLRLHRKLKAMEVSSSASNNTGMDAIALLAEIHQCDENGVSAEKWESLMDRAYAVVAQQHHT